MGRLETSYARAARQKRGLERRLAAEMARLAHAGAVPDNKPAPKFPPRFKYLPSSCVLISRKTGEPYRVPCFRRLIVNRSNRAPRPATPKHLRAHA